MKDEEGGLKNGKRARIMYTREEMEALRFVNTAEQDNLWRNIYTGLGSDYNELASYKHQKQQTPSNSDSRKRFPKKSKATGIHSKGKGEKYPENVENELQYTEDYKVENVNTLDHACTQSTGVEDCSEDYDSDDDYVSIQRPAFAVEGEPDFSSGPPEDGLEYLRRVRWEAARIPKVKVAKLDKSKVIKEQSVYIPQIPDIPKCPEHLLPLKQWEDSFLSDFSELRLVLSGLIDSNVQPAGKLQPVLSVNKDNDSCQLHESIIIENLDNLRADGVDSSFIPESSIDQPSVLNTEDSEISQSESPKTSQRDNSGRDPTLSALLRMDSVARLSMLRKRISLVETLSTLSRNDCAWLFALCLTVDTPLDADTCAAVRSLLRKCASLRAGRSELDDEVVMLNVLVTICGKYFGQSEN